MRLSKAILSLFGWKVDVTLPDYPKAIICVAPHTSNWDFVLCELAYRSIGRRSGFLMKKAWFFFPLGLILRAMGGIPVNRGKGPNESSVTSIVNRFNSSQRMVLAITPEGTRSRTDRWRTGFLNIARLANVPILLAALDFATKTISLRQTFTPTGNNDADLRAIKDFYSHYTAKYPEKFSTD